MTGKVRFQVDIKPSHQQIVRELMRRLGGVSAGDAIGFLIETQSSTALARLSSEICIPIPFATAAHPETTTTTKVTVADPPEVPALTPLLKQSVTQRHQTPQPEPQVDAGSVLASLMGS